MMQKKKLTKTKLILVYTKDCINFAIVVNLRLMPTVVYWKYTFEYNLN